MKRAPLHSPYSNTCCSSLSSQRTCVRATSLTVGARGGNWCPQQEPCLARPSSQLTGQVPGSYVARLARPHVAGHILRGRVAAPLHSPKLDQTARRGARLGAGGAYLYSTAFLGMTSAAEHNRRPGAAGQTRSPAARSSGPSIHDHPAVAHLAPGAIVASHRRHLHRARPATIRARMLPR